MSDVDWSLPHSSTASAAVVAAGQPPAVRSVAPGAAELTGLPSPARSYIGRPLEQLLEEAGLEPPPGAERWAGPLRWEVERGGRRLQVEVLPLHGAGSEPAWLVVFRAPAQGAGVQHEDILAALDLARAYSWSVPLTAGVPDWSRAEFVGPAEAITGYSPADLSEPARWLQHVHPDDRALARRVVGALFGGTLEATFRFRHRAGRTLHLHSRVVLAPDALRGITVDVSETRQAYERARSLEASARSTARLLAKVIHELRTPLQSILGFAQLLEDAQLPGKPGHWVGRILGAGRHLSGLLDNALDLARIGEGRLTLLNEPVCVLEALREAAGLLEPAARAAGVRLKVEPGGSDLVVRADAERLRQVLLNLLTNAIKYSPAGGEVRLRAVEADGWVRASVQDEGPGIAAEDLPRVFLPFERLGAERSGVPGEGLGLALSEGLARAMGGRLRAESRVGQGSTFSLELPRLSPHGPAPAGPGLFCVRFAERSLLREPRPARLKGFRPGEVLEALSWERPALLVLDAPAGSPEDPIRLLARLKRLQMAHTLPMVILTDDPALAARARRLGAQQVILPPNTQITVESLLDCLDKDVCGYGTND